MTPLPSVYRVVAALAIVALATGLGTGTTDAAQGTERKAVPLKVVVLIAAKTKGVSEEAKIKQIETLQEAPVAKKNLADVKEKDGKEVKRLNGTYVVKDAKVTLADGGAVKCQVLVAVEPGKTTLRDVKFVSTLRAISDKEASTWFGYTAVFNTPAPDPPTPSNRRTISQDEIVRCVGFSPDGTTLASGGDDKTIRLWDVASGKQRASLTGHTDWVWSVAYSPDGETLASVSKDTTIKFWDVKTGRERATLTGHTDWQCAVAFSPDGRTLAEGSKDRTIKLWDVRAAKVRSTLKWRKDWLAEQVAPLPKQEAALAYSPDGKTLASGNVDKTIKLWDVATGKERATLKDHVGRLTCLVFSPDGKTLASAGGSINLWDVATGKQRAVLMGATSLAFSPDGKTLASAGQKTITLWDVQAGKERATIKGHRGMIWSVAFSPDGKTLASGSHDKTINLWNISQGKETDTRPNEATALEGHWAAVSYSGDGEVGIVGGTGGYIPSVEALKTGKLILKSNRKLMLDPNEWSREEFHEGKLIVEDSFTGFRVDPSCQPKAIDFFLRDVDGNEVLYRGVYELKGNTLRICRTLTPNGPCPAEFTAEKGSKTVLAVWRRASP